ncbi:Src-like 3 domain protein [Rhizoctonia solani 123E]|uniref:Src-like 3 domain protein n=1 Tax=Rhizoctonia solani 123E TaxID=1423351 RepID=A0A074SJW9_9AGAM|nr:Src-like 3 domain protein [Rhizoctonia solani 123E]
MPAIPRQLFGDLSEAIESRLSTASADLFGPTSELVPTASTTQDLLLPTIPLIPGLTSQLTSLVPATPDPTIIFTSQAPATTSATPTTTSEASTTPLLTSIQIVPTSSSTLPLTTPATTPAVPNDPEVIASTSALVVTQSRSTSASATATGVSSDASITPDSGLGSGIVALIVIGALLGALLAGAFVLRRVQVRRRANRRRNSYGSPAADTAPFPFTNVSESDLKGAQPIRDPMTNYDKPLPRIMPDVYPALPDPTYNQYNQHVDNGVSGPYQTMGGAAMGHGYGYGYEQPGRVSSSSSPVQATRMTSPSPPPAAYTPGPYVYPNPLPQTPPAPALGVPVSSGLSVPQAGGRKRVIQTFQPTLPDELDVHEGDWVTVLHAYDDGWGLCECNGSRGVVPLEVRINLT